MEITKKMIIGAAKRMGVPEKALKDLSDHTQSPINYALQAIGNDMPEANNLAHSYRLIGNCSRLLQIGATNFSQPSELVLLYAALLHDIAKTNNATLRNEIQKALLRQARPFSPETADHGIRSSYYVKHKVRDSVLVLSGLGDAELTSLLSVIAFHSTGTLFPVFMPKSGPEFTDLALCLLFRLADVSDGAHWRAAASATAATGLHSSCPSGFIVGRDRGRRRRSRSPS